MRVTTVISTILLALFLGAPGISGGDGSGMRASTGGGNSAGSDPLAVAVASAAFNFSAESLSLSDGAAVTEFPNTGSYGATWDADNLVDNGGSITYQQAGDCTDSPKPCVVFDDNTLGMTFVDIFKTPTVDIQCFVYTPPTPYAGARRVYGWSNVAGTHNFVGSVGGDTQLIYDTTIATQTLTLGEVQAICWDGTDTSSVTYSVNGGAAAGPDNMDSIGDRPPQFITIGGQGVTGARANGDFIFQVVGWADDPGLTIVELSQLLHDYWS